MLSILGAIWNLFLALIPLSISILLLRGFNAHWSAFTIPQKIQILALIGICILFFPNIPYIFTDVRHILDHCSGIDEYKRCWEAPWTIPLFFTYALFALPLFMMTLHNLSTFFAKLMHPLWQKLTPIILIPLSALGICVGLFERLNSWNVLTQPFYTLQTLASYILIPEKLLLFGSFTLSLFVIFYGVQYFFVLRKKQ